MKRILLSALLCAAAAAASAASDAPPPYAGDVPAVRETMPPPARRLEPKPASEGMQLAPSEADMKKAREDRERGIVPKRTNDKRTRIETVRDQDNRVTEYIVTPGSTKIPYKIENRSDRPIDTYPGGNPSGTLGTPKFIEFGW